MAWWNRKKPGALPAEPDGPKAQWLDASDPGNPFGVPLISLMEILALTSTSKDATVAAKAVSWQPGEQGRLNYEVTGRRFPCDLAYPCPPSLPDGFLFRPRAMEDKLVLGWQGGHLAVARSWTGETIAVASGTVENGTLKLHSIQGEDGALDTLGDPAATLDWIVRSHALDERLPLPVDEDGAALLLETPLVGMSLYGHRLFCAATSGAPEPPQRRVGSDGALIAAVAGGDLAAAQALLESGASLSTCASIEETPPLHLALELGHHELARALAEHARAHPPAIDATSRSGATALIAAIVHGADASIVTAICEAGVDVSAANGDGFQAIHACAEVDAEAAIPIVVSAGAQLEARTARGFTPLHIAAGLGHERAARRLVAAGADLHSTGNGMSSTEIARTEGHEALADWFEQQ